MFNDNSERSFLLELVSVIVYVAIPAVLDNRSVRVGGETCQLDDIVGQALCEKLFLLDDLSEAFHHVSVIYNPMDKYWRWFDALRRLRGFHDLRALAIIS